MTNKADSSKVSSAKRTKKKATSRKRTSAQKHPQQLPAPTSPDSAGAKTNGTAMPQVSLRGHSVAAAGPPLTDSQLVAAAETVAQQVAEATREGPASEALDRALMILDQLKPPDQVVRVAFLRSMKPRWQKRMAPVLDALEGLQLHFGIALGASYWAQGFEFGFKEGSKLR